MSLNFNKKPTNFSPKKVQKINMKIPSNQSGSQSSILKRPNQDERHDVPMSIPMQKRALPIFKVRKRLLSEVDRQQTLIIIGETGSGKTTQIPQYMFETRMNGDDVIGVTQPRRVAAITIANRVVQEMNCMLGQEVGYCVRFEDATSDQTRIKYLTDGMLLREAMKDDLLTAYSVIILDEAHERTVHTDVLFGIVKSAQRRRAEGKMKPLKVILMSATMDVDHFSKYFNNAPTVYVEGRQHQVELMHASEPQEDYSFSCLVTIFQIHKEAPPNHDILVFLTGQEEIEAMAANIRSIAKDPACSGYPALRAYTLYAALPPSRQLEIFTPSTGNTRKVILSTNIAETSVTIPGIKYVIDSGVVKSRIHHPSTGLDMLKVQPISQSQAWQRAGRAGREAPGVCYRTFTKEEFEKLSRDPVPEIQRCNLATVALQLLALGVNPMTFDFMDKPPKEGIDEAFQLLKALGAIESEEEPKLTELGRKMALFPLDPKFSKIILSSSEIGCAEEAVSVVALLSGESVFVNNLNKREEAASARSKFNSNYGDHATLLNIFRAYNSANSKHTWCFQNFLNSRNLDYAVKVRKQLLDICRRCEVPMNSCGQDLEKLSKCLLTGLFQNVAELQSDKKYITLTSRQTVCIHPSSVIHTTLPPMVLYTELVQTGKCFMRILTPVSPEWVQDSTPKFNSKSIP